MINSCSTISLWRSINVLRRFSTPSKLFTIDVFKNLQQFAEFAYNKPNYIQEEIEKQEEDIKNDPNHIFHGQVSKIVALKLKSESDLIWPTFIETKQAAETFGHIYFHRYGGVDEMRYDNTLNILKGKERNRGVCWFGLPGIGKSTAINYILFQLLANLGKSDFPERVYYRSSTEGVFTFFINENNNMIQVQAQKSSFVGQDMEFIKQNLKLNQNSCLIIELGEDEVDPKPPRIPTLVTASTSNADDTVKTMLKSNAKPLLVGPPTNQQMYYIEKTRLEEKTQPLWYMDPIKCTPSDFEDEVWRRINLVGPIPRAFSNDITYKACIEALTTSPNLFKRNVTQLKSLSVYNVPSFLKYFLAPYPLTPQIEAGSYYYEFLSDKARHVFEENQSEIDENLLSGYNINYLIAKGIVKDALMENSDVMKSWQWVEDVGYKTKLLQQHILSKPCFDIPKFDDGIHIVELAFIDTPTNELKENLFYISRVHSFSVGDLFYIDHLKQIIYFIQTTLKNTRYHGVSIPVLEKVMDKLGMFKEIGDQYNLHIIFVIDKGIQSPTGSAFILPSPSGEAQTMMTLEDWKQSDQNNIAKRVHTSLIRATLSPSNTFDLLKKSISTKSLTPTKIEDLTKYENTGELMKLLRGELMELCKEYHLPIYGTKAILANRLFSFARSRD